MERDSGKRLARAALPPMAFLLACGPGAANTNPESQQPPKAQAAGDTAKDTDYYLIINGPSRYTSGPHDTLLKDGIRDAIDIAPEEVVDCVPGERKVLDHPPIVAPASGKVIIVGDDHNRNDPMHSVVAIESNKGEIVGVMHTAEPKVKVGQEVVGGQTEIAKFSCEYPPGGLIRLGMHGHVFVWGKDREQKPIQGKIFSGYQVIELPGQNQGAMFKEGEDLKVADKGRCGPSVESKKPCGGRGNDLYSNGSNQLAKQPSTPTKEPTKVPPTPTTPALAQKDFLPTNQGTTEDQARAVALNYWYELFSSQQDDTRPQRENYVTFYSEVTNPPSWQKALTTAFREGSYASKQTELKVSWQFSTAFGNFFQKYKGETLINDIGVPTPNGRNLSPAERRNGLIWEGPVSIRFTYQYHFLREWAQFVQPNNYEIANLWFPLPYNKPLPDKYSPAKDDVWSVLVRLNDPKQTGKPIWEVVGVASNHKIRDDYRYLANMPVPTKGMMMFADTSSECWDNRVDFAYCPPAVDGSHKFD